MREEVTDLILYPNNTYWQVHKFYKSADTFPANSLVNQAVCKRHYKRSTLFDDTRIIS